MGACDISFQMPGTPSFSAIEKQFKDQQREDASDNGSRDGYSGDFQTVHAVKDHTHKTFDSHNEAHDYCMNESKKWEFVVAVRYRILKEFKASAKLTKLNEKVKELAFQLQANERLPLNLKPFQTCEGCESRVNTKHMRGHKCPVCHEGDFRRLSVQRSEVKLRAKHADAVKEYETLLKKEREQQLKTKGTVGTLVAGWGAC